MTESLIPMTIVATKNAAEAITDSWNRAQRLRDRALQCAADACKAALECGELLLCQKGLHKGTFLLWMKNNCPEVKFSTAFKYMRIAQFRRSQGDQPLGLRTINDYYRACGLIPPRQSLAKRNAQQHLLAFWVYATKLKHWLPQIPDHDKPRVRAWWEDLGLSEGWLKL